MREKLLIKCYTPGHLLYARSFSQPRGGCARPDPGSGLFGQAPYLGLYVRLFVLWFTPETANNRAKMIQIWVQVSGYDSLLPPLGLTDAHELGGLGSLGGVKPGGRGWWAPCLTCPQSHPCPGTGTAQVTLLFRMSPPPGHVSVFSTLTLLLFWGDLTIYI